MVLVIVATGLSKAEGVLMLQWLKGLVNRLHKNNLVWLVSNYNAKNGRRNLIPIDPHLF